MATPSKAEVSKRALKSIAKDAGTTRLRSKGDQAKINALLIELGLVEKPEDEDDDEEK